MRSNLVMSIVAILFSLLVYFNSLNNHWVLDDGRVIIDNVYITSLRYLPIYFQGKISPLPSGPIMLRPLWMLSYNLNFMVGGYNVWTYRIFQIILHGVNVFLLYLLFSLLFPEAHRGLRYLFSVMFAVHPVNTEAVNYLSARSDLMVTLFILLVVVLFLKWEESGKRKFLVWSYICLLLAYLSKEFAIGLPIFLLIYLAIKGEIRKKIKVYLPYLFITTGIIFYWWILFSGNLGEYFPDNLIQNIVSQLKVGLLYLKLFFFPKSLCIVHEVNGGGYWVGLVIVAVMIGAIMAFYRDNRFMIGIAFFISFLLPKCFVKLNFPAMEHHFYLAEIGIWIAVFSVVYRISFRKMVFISVGVITIFSCITYCRNRVWESEKTVWLDAFQKNPESSPALISIGLVYLKSGNYKLAEKFLLKALRKCKEINRLVLIIRGIVEVYRKEGHVNKAEHILYALYKIFPRDFALLHSLGVICIQKGEYKRAEHYYLAALKINPYYLRSIFNLGLLYLNQGEIYKARNYFQKYVRLKPRSAQGYLYIGLTYEREGVIPQAIFWYEKALHYEPDSISGNFALGSMYARIGDPRAEYYLRKVVVLMPDKADAWYNLGLFYLERGKVCQAEECIRRAERLGYPVSGEIKEILKK